MEASSGVIDELLDDLRVSPHCETPAQFADQSRTNGAFLAERRLWAAAFELALADWRRTFIEADQPPPAGIYATRLTSSRLERWRAELTAWFTDDSEAPLSFRWYCSCLGLDAQAVRRRVMNGGVIVPRRSPPTDRGIPIDYRDDPNAYMRAYRAANPKVREYNREWMRRTRGSVKTGAPQRG